MFEVLVQHWQWGDHMDTHALEVQPLVPRHLCITLALENSVGGVSHLDTHFSQGIGTLHAHAGHVNMVRTGVILIDGLLHAAHRFPHGNRLLIAVAHDQDGVVELNVMRRGELKLSDHAPSGLVGNHEFVRNSATIGDAMFPSSEDLWLTHVTSSDSSFLRIPLNLSSEGGNDGLAERLP